MARVPTATARFRAVCPVCVSGIHPGQKIKRLRRVGWVHDSCFTAEPGLPQPQLPGMSDLAC